MAVNYQDFIIHIKKSGQKLKKFKCSCDSCGKDRGYLPKSKAFRVCHPCKVSQPEYRVVLVKAIKAVRSTEQSRLKTKQQMDNLWGAQRANPDYLLNVKIKNRLRSRLSHAIKNNEKYGSAVEDLGCSIEELKHHLESKFQLGMTWDNYGINGWEIDHIKPLFRFNLTNKEEFFKANHYSNLQPLWVAQNRTKGSIYE
jgi:hypothetical protein